ncbi:aminotransferase class I/II-fold pyridoxal phosphate-dependent enzyme [Polaribacter sp. Q13]|uniref:aminotransferase class I/II-fold pyridoxal phosphate-dependent enzyme n=1 Tax=Polaribacter sp. Q13 TaxID=2806551 RepID=UPI00193B69B9|nr:aminotransferase class I/II-fold pyridoxal phosphate-dependent enzyme [Polaribacter sp. Q13]QVY67321.1 aminotransferase class I/II-fold pyridoxal phosphate-dependent enzyme [Polaribacter sp. Q13]
MQNKIPLSESIINIDLKTNFSSIGTDDVKNFENSLEAYYEHQKRVVAVNSGTSAIHLALILSGVEKGDEVLCQSLTYIATASPILYQKAIPIFIDSEKETWNMCPDQLELAIKDRILKGKKPKAIIFVHLYGMPAKVDEIVRISRKYNITLIEDAAEALGAEYKGKKCGTFGDFGILSFNNNKIVSTLGGGALICNTEKEKEKAFFYATQAKEKENYYEHKVLGYNYRMNSLGARLGVSQLKKLPEYLKKRRAINDFYKDYFKRFFRVQLLKEPSASFVSNYWLSCILFELEGVGDSTTKIMTLLRENNIESRLLWKPMHLQPLFKNHPYYGGKVAENLFKKGLCLPSGSNLEKNDLLRISESIKNFL